MKSVFPTRCESQPEATRGVLGQGWGPCWPPEHLWADEGPGDRGGHLLPPGEPALPRGDKMTTHGDHREARQAFSGMLYLASTTESPRSDTASASVEREAGRPRGLLPSDSGRRWLWGRCRRRVLPRGSPCPPLPASACRPLSCFSRPWPRLLLSCPASGKRRWEGVGGQPRRARLSSPAGTAHASRGPPTFRP